MDKYLNAKELLELALRIEENGAKFYGHSFSIVKDEKVKAELQMLASWESDHVDHVKKLFKNISNTSDELPLYFSPEEDSSLYMKSLADSHVFIRSVNVDGLISGCTTTSAILSLALMFENDSVNFYRSLETKLIDTDAKALVAKIAEEEELHVKQIQKIIEQS